LAQFGLRPCDAAGKLDERRAAGAHAARNAIHGRLTAYTTVPYYWSDWYDRRIQFVGLPEADEVVVYGSVGEDQLTALYRIGDQIGGALTLNRPRHIMKLRALIASKADWPEAVELVERTAAPAARN
jgi:hypothetical protein